MVDERELQGAYLQFQAIKEQIEAGIKEKGMVDQKLVEIIQAKSAIKELQSIKDKREVWTPVGAGSFVSADLKHTGEVAVALGAGIVAKKSSSEAIDILQKREDELSAAERELVKGLQSMQAHANQLETFMQQAINEMESNKAEPKKSGNN
ncbi:MAG: prefoldin subunit alpha [Candidatus Aenigmatarchaeota archaeon]